jgi:hypothetical protein
VSDERPQYNVRIEIPQADPEDLRAVFLRPVDVAAKDLPVIRIGLNRPLAVKCSLPSIARA